MNKILIIGSGASSVHFALSILRKGYEVRMVDVGYERPEAIHPERNIDSLKDVLYDPVDYFLGEDFQSFISPDADSEYYGFPPNKEYVFSMPGQFSFSSKEFSPLFSFAQGGLAEAWTGGVYPFNDYELSGSPFSYSELLPYYNKVAERIGITGTQDDLSFFYPYHENLMEPFSLDQHSMMLLSKYNQKKRFLNEKLGFYMGHSRVATLSCDKEGRKACTYCRRCLWGCPVGALYTPSLTLEECKGYSNFKYLPGMFVNHFNYDSQNNITSVVAESLKDSKIHVIPLDKLVLGAGTLSSSKIFMDSVFRKTGEVVKLKGLMDNRQILAPFLNLRVLGKTCDPESYQYHQVAMCIKRDDPKKYIHGQITTLKSALIHPIIQRLPFDLKTSLYAFSNLHSALGVINLNFHDFRRDENYVSLSIDKDLTKSTLLINYTPVAREENLMKRTMKIVKKAFLRLGCIVPAGMTHIRPMGASVHYAGTIPMSEGGATFTASRYCQSNDFKNLYFIDGTTFPFLPAKQLTFTMMANAVRVADCEF